METQINKDDYRSVKLECINFWIKRAFPNYQIGLNVDREFSLGEQIVYEIETNILGKKKIQTYDVVFKVPKNWFQHFKEQVIPNSWFTKAFPVKHKNVYKNIKVNCFALFPELEAMQKGYEIYFYTNPFPEASIKN